METKGSIIFPSKKIIAGKESGPMSRRRFQRGSLTKEGDRWIARWREDVRVAGGEVKRVRKKEVLGSLVEYPTKKLAERALVKRLEPINSEDYKPTSTIRFEQFAEKWKSEIMIHHKDSSQSSEKSLIRTQLVPFFGGYELRHISLEMIQKFVNTSDKAPNTIKNAISVLMVMWDMARAWGYAQHNPFPRGTNGRLLLRLPRIVKGGTYNFTVSETMAIIDKAKGRWKTFFRVLAETGMRPGELAGLRTSDVGKRTIRIAQSVWQQKVQTPKTENAMRTFAISDELGRELHHLISKSEANAFDLVFATDPGRGKKNPGGKPLSMDNFRNRVLNPILDELGIRDKIKALGVRGGNYAFRHMNATLMDELNTPLKTRQKRLGHADIATTLGHYSHAVDADDLAAADAIGEMLSSKGRGAVQ